MNFPCKFPIKIIGLNQPHLLEDIRAIILEWDNQFDPNTIVKNPSGKDKYLALTVVVHVENQATLDTIYRAVNRHPLIKMVL